MQQGGSFLLGGGAIRAVMVTFINGYSFGSTDF